MDSYLEIEMEEVKRCGPQLEDLADLFHHIQSFLPVQDAARTCTLSKSWLHAWSTIPTLRFYKPLEFVSSKRDISLIHRTVQRYYQHNIPIQTFDLRIKIKNKKSASLVNKWIQKVATQRCLKNLSLVICNVMVSSKFILLDIFSAENLYTINIRRDGRSSLAGSSVWVSQNPVINCVSLRVLELYYVEVSDEVLNNLFSTCTLLEKIDLSSCRGFMKIKIKNLRYLQKLRLVSYLNMGSTLWVTRNSCVSLRVLELLDVEISDEVLNNLLSTCTLLETIRLSSCRGFKKIKIKNLRYLQKFRLKSYSKEEEDSEILEVDDVPSLISFQYKSKSKYWCYRKNPTFNIDSLSSSLTELSLFDVIIDVAYFDKIIPKFPFLESLKLKFCDWSPEKLVITSASLKKLTLRLFGREWERLFGKREFDVQVYAPKLLHLFYDSHTIANLSLQNPTTPEKIELHNLKLGKPTDNHCLYKLRELLKLSSKFDHIGIKFDCLYYLDDVLDMDIDDLKRQFPFPATNVHQLLFYSFSDNGLVHPSYFDALFTICHPNSILAGDITHNYSNLISELVRRKKVDLKHIEFKNPSNNKWEELTESISPSTFETYSPLELKPYWCSP
ncbi:uncharacterized protein [Rutidosis leptorrhynchoides]|uniref:uncharacterized protein n=1 Tax=Rutidosis leptorrhynchoides TaxID=125765 RepID=UPI003A98EF69